MKKSFPSFDIIISLGINCDTRYQISRILWKRKFGTDKNFQINKQDYGTHFFDSCITPIGGLITILQNNFKGALEQDKLKTKKLDNGSMTVVDLFTGIEYPHEFDLKDGSNKTELIKNHYSEFRKKYDYLANKMRNLFNSDKTILFVRCGPVDDNNLNILVNCLNEITDDYRLLYLPWCNRYQIDNCQSVLKRKEIIYDTIKHEEYPGDNASWDLAFERISFYLPEIKENA